MKLLRIDSSARSNSVSRQLTSHFVATWKMENPEGEVINRDLAATALPLITDDWSATFGDPEKLTLAQRQYLSTSDALIEELFSADIILVGSPMYNFTVSWPLKAWIDQIVRLGKTVLYDANGPKGLLGGRKVIVLTSRGGGYQPGTLRAACDFQEPYLRRIFAFLGLKDMTFIHAENQMRRELAEPSRATALERVAQIAAETLHTIERPN